GNTSRNMGTPEGVYTILKKMTDTDLVGPDYVSHVNYWMPIVGNSIGIHDATWRSKFGDSIYKTAGSHGCINVPLSVMEKLYPMVARGTTVVVFN
ncbi:MAG: L,D-transpeptidase, partial [Lachnospiraceae bacterium]|nr:L,D-transpeptidase [Lachnospiraceae bacterium]